MSEPIRSLDANSLIAGWDFSTGGVKCLVFSLSGEVVAEVRLPTDLWTEKGVSELNLMQLEGQARASTRAITAQLKALGRLGDWVAGGISATHHTAGRIDVLAVQVRRAICWNDQTLADFHELGLARLGGQEEVRRLIHGPWAIRYTLSHLVKDEARLAPSDWLRTHRILPHGGLAGGFLTGNFDQVSQSVAASTGIMDLRSRQWRREMLGAIDSEEYRELAWRQLPEIIDYYQPLGRLTENLAMEAGIALDARPTIYPTSDDQQAGLVGGGAVEPGHVAMVLGNSAVVNSSGSDIPSVDNLDVMRLNWGPFLWMRCYSNGAQFLDDVVGTNPDWASLEAAAREVPAGCNGVSVLPFVLKEPSLGVDEPRLEWLPEEPSDPGTRFRASLEALAYLMALGAEAHEAGGQRISRVSVSGGISQSELMCEILASVVGRPLQRLESAEGPALGAAVTAVAAHESALRRQAGETTPFSVADAAEAMIQVIEPAKPNAAWAEAYQRGLAEFRARLVP